jgi:signal transduction histidine kinase
MRCNPISVLLAHRHQKCGRAALAAVDPVMVYGTNGRPALVADTAAIHWIDVSPLVGRFAARSSIVVPLVLDELVVGSFNVDSFTPKFYTEQHLERAVALGECVTQALHNVRLFELERQRVSAAEELARMKDDFVATVSHELRTPLTAVIGYAELLEARWNSFDDAARLHQIHKIVLAANRQRRVVEDVLVLSSLERQGPGPAPVAMPVRLVTLLHQARHEVRGNYRDQIIDLDVADDLQVLADSGRATRVLVNLLDNAAKYSPVGCPILVDCTLEAGMGVVRVRDFGPGVPEEDHAILFTRFGRVSGSRMRVGRVGIGLGLYLSRHLAEAMGGDVDLEQTGQEGSVFRLRLPAVPTNEGAARPDLDALA